ncbi:hypothetical protein C1701_00525 [Actinoalloteichus sp. AHMU CJ021]|uniref:hypothetical protein n=1 Tax=Actinoalloteichus TaxID=65496 RepID=UPI000CA01396|nr:hypothetical protein [Actinoalloteichus spitiensis]AUS77090.1 hypothetical protein C1701_00525 [Actinoalloteichus sp. AHMU CJ021]
MAWRPGVPAFPVEHGHFAASSPGEPESREDEELGAYYALTQLNGDTGRALHALALGGFAT